MFAHLVVSLVETGDALWRGDEPSPTRSSVMVRFSHSHIRFGTFERLHYLRRPDLITKLLDFVIEYYYPKLHLKARNTDISQAEKYTLFYAELVKKVAELVAQWMAAGFCHAVLNTDNMSITGESFDYGPFAFIPTYDPKFTAAYFDHYGLYCYGNQPFICKGNLEKLQEPLAAVIDRADMDVALAKFGDYYNTAYRQLMLNRLGFEDLPEAEGDELLKVTIKLLAESQVDYQGFFFELRKQFNRTWRDDASQIFSEAKTTDLIAPWRQFYCHVLQTLSADDLDKMADRLRLSNPEQSLLRPTIEAVWEPIALEDNWQPFYELVKRLQDS